MTAEQFHVARYNGILAVMKKERDLYDKLNRKYLMLQSEHNILKKTYLDLLEGHLDIVNGKTKTIKKLRERIKKLKEEFDNDLFTISKNLTINNETDSEEARRETIERVNYFKKKWKND